MACCGKEISLERAKNVFKSITITVEPVLFLISFVQGLYLIIAQNLYLAKACSVNFNYTEDICDNIFEHKEIQVEVQKKVSELQAYNGVLQALPAALYTLFAGPWSDIHGRKVLIIWSSFGYIINNLICLINTYWWHELKADYLLFESLQDCTGGYACFFLGCYSYISDITLPKNRTKRMAFLDGLFPIGFFTGMSLSGIIKKNLGFYANFGLGMAAAFLATMYGIFILKDSRDMRPPEVMKELEKKKVTMETDGPKRNIIASIFDLKNLSRAFRIAFKRRPYGVRPYIIFLGTIFVFKNFIDNGKDAVIYLFLRKEFNWDEVIFGRYNMFIGILGLLAQYLAVPFLSENLQLADTTIGFIAVFGCAVEHVMFAFTDRDWVLYLAGVIAFMSPCTTTTCRSSVTKCVGVMEFGAVFSVMAAFQAMTSLIAGPIYGFTYKATIKTFPGAFLMFTAAIFALSGVLMIVVNLGLRRADRKKIAKEAKAAEENNSLVEAE